MLSVIMYGRNDDHGYNLHKRTAMSINSYAQILENSDDEIIFVDCNTPDDMPTLIEDIWDTLTSVAQESIKVVRVRPALFDKHRKDTHLPVLEPHCRNLAVYMANPKNKWIISTNSDIVIVQEFQHVPDWGTLEDGIYISPRMSVPECIWSKMRRAHVSYSIYSLMAHYGIDTIATTDEYTLYDGCGDFQLFTRDAFNAIGGFDERMIYGWHVDSNFAKRMHFYYGGITRSFEKEMKVMHLDHTRKLSPAHAPGHRQNDTKMFYGDITEHVPLMVPFHGHGFCNADEVEIVYPELNRFGGFGEYDDEQSQITVPLAGEYDENTFYITEKVFPYVANLVETMPPKNKISYYGGNIGMRSMVNRYRMNSGAEKTDIGDDLPFYEYERLADAFIFDTFDDGTAEQPAHAAWLIKHFIYCIAREKLRLEATASKPRLFIIIGARNTYFEGVTNGLLGIVHTSYSSNVQHGYIKPDAFDAPFMMNAPNNVDWQQFITDVFVNLEQPEKIEDIF